MALKFARSFFSSLLCTAALAAFFAPLNPATASDALKIGSLPAADSLILYAAERDGAFARQGLEVQVVPFQSALELGAAMRAGSLDGHFGDIINVLMQNESGAPQTIIATTSHSRPGARHFALCLSPKSDVQSTADLAKKTCAIGRATIVEFVLDKLLAREGRANVMEKQDIRQIPVRVQLLLSGKTEAALLPEPLVTLVQAGGAKILLDDRDLDLPLAVIALRRPEGPAGNALADRMRRFRAALAEEAERINADPKKYKAMMLELKLLPRPAAETYAMVQFDGRFTPLGLPSEKDMEIYGEWMKKSGMLKKGLPAYHDIVFEEGR